MLLLRFVNKHEIDLNDRKIFLRDIVKTLINFQPL